MIKKKNKEDDTNFIGQTTAVFAEYYNKNIPKSFPRVSIKKLREFQTRHPSLFKNKEEWTINKHRKKLMDWLSSHREEQ